MEQKLFHIWPDGVSPDFVSPVSEMESVNTVASGEVIVSISHYGKEVNIGVPEFGSELL